MNDRRDFLKKGVAAAGLGFTGDTGIDKNCPEENVEIPGPIPLNNVLTSFQQVNQKYGAGLTSKTVCDEDSWYHKRQSILERSKIILGNKPPVEEARHLQAEFLKREKRNGYEEIKLQFASGTGDLIKGYLLVPDNASPGNPAPAVIAMHSTGPGARQTIGIEPRENRVYGKEMALRGYVVLAIDVIAAGERIFPNYEAYYTKRFYEQWPEWSAMGKMIHDHQSGLDFLTSLAYVDADRLACIGHSLGGYNAYFLQAFDERIRAAVTSCGISPMGESNMPYQFARSEWFVHFNPVSRAFISAGMVPCDLHEIMALCAPKPLFNYSSRKDNIYYPSSVRKDNDFSEWWFVVDRALDQVAQVYNILGKPENFVRRSSNGGHDFPEAVRQEAYEWLDERLKK